MMPIGGMVGGIKSRNSASTYVGHELIGRRMETWAHAKSI